ncbi:MAG: pantoate--beta-alanine ligase [Candidatus Micrarchaeia archaeon]
MKLAKTAAEMQKISLNLRAKGKTIGFVPTMGALHGGHASLLRAARKKNDSVVLSIFVNPAQFGPKEDFSKYPRPLAKDLALARREKVDFVFAPSVDEMYPPGFNEFAEPGKVALPLCGKSRPGHFKGVATAVARLFKIVCPTRAYFGQKDYQQTRVVEQLVRGLGLPVKIIVCPIVREKDGLAKSSRNAYLSERERRAATILSRSLRLAKKLFAKGERDARKIVPQMKALINSEPLARIDYVEIRDAENLSKIGKISRPAVAALAVFVGKTRLIDNAVLRP